MPINRSGSNIPNPSIARADVSTSSPESSKFQGRRVSAAAKQQSENFLSAGDARRPSYIPLSSRDSVSDRNISAQPTTRSQTAEPNYQNIMPPIDNYEYMAPQQADYERMNPPSDIYVNIASPMNDYDKIDSSIENSYLETRAVIDSPTATKIKFGKIELPNMEQLSSECEDYIKEVEVDLRNATQCAKKPEATSVSDLIALKNFIIPQHVNCIGDYIKSVQTLLKFGELTEGQRAHLETSNHQLAAMRSELLNLQGFIREAVKAENFSTEAIPSYADLKAERESTAGQLMKTQSEILTLYKNVDKIKSMVDDLSNLPIFSRGNEEELHKISVCKRNLIELKAKLPRCIDNIKKGIDTINLYEARSSEASLPVGEQKTIREQRYTMRLSRHLEVQIKNINNTISENWEKLKKMTSH